MSKRKASVTPPPANRNQRVGHAVIEQTHSYSGPVPPPDVLQGFDRIAPGTAQRLIDMAVDESNHRRQMELKALQANLDAQKKQQAVTELQARAEVGINQIGMWAGIFLAFSCVAGAVYIAPVSWQVGVALVGMPIATIIRSIWRR